MSPFAHSKNMGKHKGRPAKPPLDVGAFSLFANELFQLLRRIRLSLAGKAQQPTHLLLQHGSDLGVD